MSDRNDGKDEFERKLEVMPWHPGVPGGMRDALIEVADTLEFAVAIAKSRLGDNWTGADAIEICRMVLARQEHQLRERQREDSDDVI